MTASTIEGESELSTAVVPLILGYQSSSNYNPLQGPANLSPYTGAMMSDLTVEQPFTWHGSVLNHPIQRLPSEVSSHQPESKQDN